MKEIASLIGTAIRDADGSRTAEVAAGVRELVGAHPAYPEPHARRLTDARVRRRPAHRGAGHLPDHARGADGGDPLPDDGRPPGAGRARHPDAAGRRRGHVPRGGRRHPRGHPAAGAAADLRRLADLRRPGRRRADLPARRARRQVGPGRAHQADRPDRRGRRHGAARRPAGVPVPAGRRHRHDLARPRHRRAADDPADRPHGQRAELHRRPRRAGRGGLGDRRAGLLRLQLPPRA